MRIYIFCIVLSCTLLWNCKSETSTTDTPETTSQTTPIRTLNTLKSTFIQTNYEIDFLSFISKEDSSFHNFITEKKNLGKYADFETLRQDLGGLFEITWVDTVMTVTDYEGKAEEGEYRKVIDLKLLQPSTTRKTMLATFDGSEWGDYFYISFTNKENGESIGFGDGRNTYGKYEDLGGDGDEAKMKSYIGKTFEVEWDSLLSLYYCCEGGMDNTIGVQPTIVGLKLVE